MLNRTRFTRAHMALYRQARQLDQSYQRVWANDLPCLYPAYCLARDKGAFLVYDTHEIYLETVNQFFPRNTNPFKRLFHNWNASVMKFLGGVDERRYGAKADLVLTVNESLGHYFLDKYDWKEIGVLRNCPELVSIKKVDLKAQYNLTSDAVLLLYQGNLNYGRGLELLIRSMVHLPNYFVLLILGDGFIKSELRELALQLSLEKRVIFGGNIEQALLLNYTVGADIGVNLLEPFNLSKAMASPNKLYEYAHAGIPVLCSDTFENRNFLDAYPIGLLTENTESSIAFHIKKFAHFRPEPAVFNSCREEMNWTKQFEQCYDQIDNLMTKKS